MQNTYGGEIKSPVDQEENENIWLYTCVTGRTPDMYFIDDQENSTVYAELEQILDEIGLSKNQYNIGAMENVHFLAVENPNEVLALFKQAVEARGKTFLP